MDPSQMTLATGLCGASVVLVFEVDAVAGVRPCPGCGGMSLFAVCLCEWLFRWLVWRGQCRA